MRDPRLFVISLIIFIAWVSAARGWVLLAALIWLVYPAVACYRYRRHKYFTLD